MCVADCTDYKYLFIFHTIPFWKTIYGIFKQSEMVHWPYHMQLQYTLTIWKVFVHEISYNYYRIITNLYYSNRNVVSINSRLYNRLWFYWTILFKINDIVLYGFCYGVWSRILFLHSLHMQMLKNNIITNLERKKW